MEKPELSIHVSMKHVDKSDNINYAVSILKTSKVHFNNLRPDSIVCSIASGVGIYDVIINYEIAPETTNAVYCICEKLCLCQTSSGILPDYLSPIINNCDQHLGNPDNTRIWNGFVKNDYAIELKVYDKTNLLDTISLPIIDDIPREILTRCENDVTFTTNVLQIPTNSYGLLGICYVNKRNNLYKLLNIVIDPEYAHTYKYLRETLLYKSFACMKHQHHAATSAFDFLYPCEW